MSTTRSAAAVPDHWDRDRARDALGAVALKTTNVLGSWGCSREDCSICRGCISSATVFPLTKILIILLPWIRFQLPSLAQSQTQATVLSLSSLFGTVRCKLQRSDFPNPYGEGEKVSR